ncbi:MAG TPA: putative glycoside hydrolase [Acidimicrobiia bacterium]|nr:putative glycoside hydrolase [Acidimicrobiia bacterium]
MRRGIAIAVLLSVAACTGEPGGGGVNLETSTTASLPPSSTTTGTLPPTTTTTTVRVFQVSGRVTDEDGSPVPRALVTMGDLRSTSDPDGWFSFDTTTPTSMTISKPGWSSTELAWDETAPFFEATIAPQTIRALRVAGEAAANDAAFEALLQLADSTAVNALVFDTKRESGEVLYATGVQAAHDTGAVTVMYDPAARIAQAHERGLYTVTRIASFEDDIRSSAVAAEKLAGSWIDPESPTARRYVLDLAVEACTIGFDEIQFDYVRYPAGQTAEVSGQRNLTQEHRLGVVSSFLAEARELLHPMGCAVSAAIFGIVTSTPDDQGLGQRPEEVSAQVDAVSPMVYPSHYSPGWLGFEDPNDYPYEVTADAIGDALPRIQEGSSLRPYLQAFWWSNAQIKRSIQAAEDAGVGWILWNILSNFDPAAIPTDTEVGG